MFTQIRPIARSRRDRIAGGSRRDLPLLPDIARELPGEFLPVVLYTAINRQGVIRLWPVRLPAPDGRVNEWHRSAREAAILAMERWIRVKANMPLGAYDIFEASSTIPDPDWPSLSFEDLLRIGSVIGSSIA